MCRRTTFSVVFFCKKTKVNKKGKAPIYARITTSGQIYRDPHTVPGRTGALESAVGALHVAGCRIDADQ